MRQCACNSIASQILRQRLRARPRVQLQQSEPRSQPPLNGLPPCVFSRLTPCAQVFMLLDEFILAGEVQETSKQVILGCALQLKPFLLPQLLELFRLISKNPRFSTFAFENVTSLAAACKTSTSLTRCNVDLCLSFFSFPFLSDYIVSRKQNCNF